jgi:hypothetical protein
MKIRQSTPLAILVTAGLICAACDRERPPRSADAGGSGAASGPDFTYESLVELVTNPDHFAVARTLGERLPTLGPGSLPALKEVLENASDVDLDAVSFELLMRYWALHEPAEATYFAMVKAPRAYAVAAIYATLWPWAAADPQKALENAKIWTMAEGDPGAAAQIALVRGWYDSGKPGLEQYIQDLGASFQRQRAVLTYATAMIRAHGGEAAIRWAEAVPKDDAPYKADVLQGVASALVPLDLDAAQRFCDAHCEGPNGSTMRDWIARRWSRRDGAAAIEWLAKAPESAQRDVTIRYTYSVWAGRVPETALRWLKEKRAANPRPAWIAATTPPYARALGQTEPAEALSVAEEIAGPQERDMIKVEILRGWRQRDEAAAERWLQASSLAADVLARVRQPQTSEEKAAQEQLRIRQAAPKS